MSEADPTKDEATAYEVSGWLAAFLVELKERSLLEGPVREVAGVVIERYRKQAEVDPIKAWQLELVQLYAEIHGRDPAAPTP